MIFDDILRTVVEGVPGGQGAVVMGMDGIAVGEHVADPSLPIQTVGVEYATALKSIQNAARSLEAGGLDEVAIRTERTVFLLRVISPEYFAAVALSPEGNLGKARFLLRLAAPRLAKELS